MNRTLTLTNTLLAIIALCLCLLVARVYDVDVVPAAQAHDQIGPMDVRVVNDSLPCTVQGRVVIGTDHGVGFQPLHGTDGALDVVVRER